jgi:PadR family transcriptional regulator AphA
VLPNGTPTRSIVKQVVGDLTSTSYAVLSLLGVQPWSAYELTQQMTRSLSWYWPKAESLVYAECKKLAGRGLATSERQHQGRRPRTVYAITDTGRAALRRWLDQPLNPRPRLEFEAMLQIAFADHGTREQLLVNLDAIIADAEQRREQAMAQMRNYALGGPFPARLPVAAMTGKFFLEYADLIARWSTWAREAVCQWDGLNPPAATVPDRALEPGTWPSGN